MEVSHKPNMDLIAAKGYVGLVHNVPPGMPPGSDVANLAVMGYDPQIYYTGRSPLEAVSIGVNLDKNDVAFRCNLVTLSDEPSVYDKKIMIDYSSDEITTEESKILISDLAANLNTYQLHFYSGISYRHLMVWHDGPIQCQLTPPHDISDRKISEYLPHGEGSLLLLDLMKRSSEILKDHPINLQRKAKGLRPASSIWLWGQGKKPNISSFHAKYGLNGAVISAVDLAKGLGMCAGLKVIDVPGATGNVHTNFKGKAEAALSGFRSGLDFVYLHIEAPDEAGHRGEVDNKVLAIEKIDSEVLDPILAKMPEISEEFKIMVLPDHPTPLVLKTHVPDPVPFLIYNHLHPKSSFIEPFTEKNSARTGICMKEGHLLMERFIKQPSM
jgi:2,3-bisphosphoglycerate-independent phosphoglycerate mutase